MVEPPHGVAPMEPDASIGATKAQAAWRCTTVTSMRGMTEMFTGRMTANGASGRTADGNQQDTMPMESGHPIRSRDPVLAPTLDRVLIRDHAPIQPIAMDSSVARHATNCRACRITTVRVLAAAERDGSYRKTGSAKEARVKGIQRSPIGKPRIWTKCAIVWTRIPSPVIEASNGRMISKPNGHSAIAADSKEVASNVEAEVVGASHAVEAEDSIARVAEASTGAEPYSQENSDIS